MITVGSLVKVKDNYSGNLENVKGKVGKVVSVSRPKDEAVQSTYLLDIKGQYSVESSYYKGEFYKYTSQTVVFSDEIEEFSYGMKDAKGALLEIGDKVVYSGNRPGIIEGEVVNFKTHEEQRWGQGREVLKVQLKIARTVYHYDGERRYETEEFYTQWFEHGSRMIIVQKNLSDIIFTGKPFVLNY